MSSLIPILIIIILAILLFISSIRIVPQANAYVIERLGAYNGTWQVGLHMKVPLIDKIAKTVSLKEHVLDFDPQPVITKDNVTMEIDTVIYFQITDPKLYAYGVANPMAAIENLTATTLRNIIGDLELDQTLTSRELINTKMRTVLDEATDPWGIKINRVEVKNIMPPTDIQDAMEKQMRAERERREAIIRAEGQKRSAILVAEGNKEAAILEAEANKQAAIKTAEGEAEAIRMINQATADAIRMLVESRPTREIIALKSLETFEQVADGKSTKIIIPSDIAGLAGLATSFKELIKEEEATRIEE
jgi:regulator of protease activity HflC (stomatin/prohibitin superfamily)